MSLTFTIGAAPWASPHRTKYTKTSRNSGWNNNKKGTTVKWKVNEKLLLKILFVYDIKTEGLLSREWKRKKESGTKYNRRVAILVMVMKRSKVRMKKITTTITKPERELTRFKNEKKNTQLCHLHTASQNTGKCYLLSSSLLPFPFFPPSLKDHFSRSFFTAHTNTLNTILLKDQKINLLWLSHMSYNNSSRSIFSSLSVVSQKKFFFYFIKLCQKNEIKDCKGKKTNRAQIISFFKECSASDWCVNIEKAHIAYRSRIKSTFASQLFSWYWQKKNRK